MAPDVILEVDHIVPVAEGGGNDIVNLITSCRECNRGKGKRRLDDHTEVRKQVEQIRELAIKREQINMLIEWRESLADIKNTEVDAINRLISRMTGEWELNDNGRATIRRYIDNFGFEEVYTATEIAFSKYYIGDDSFNNALAKIGGVCYNRKVGRTKDFYE